MEHFGFERKASIERGLITHERHLQIGIVLQGGNRSIDVGGRTKVASHRVQGNPHGGLFLDFEQLTSHVIAAGGTNHMCLDASLTLLAVMQLRNFDGIVASSAARTALRLSSLRYGHVAVASNSKLQGRNSIRANPSHPVAARLPVTRGGMVREPEKECQGSGPAITAFPSPKVGFTRILCSKRPNRINPRQH